jgi:adenine phosphoribosyltransferase
MTSHVAHGLDGRYGPMEPGALLAAIRKLADVIDVTVVDYVLGFPEGGVPPAFAFAQVVDRPLVLSTRLRLPLPHCITFDEPLSTVGKTHYIHGLHAGDRVVIVEDEITTGGTVINAVRALRHAGVRVDQVGVVLAVDAPPLWAAMEAAGIALRATFLLPADRLPEHVARLGKPMPE